MKAPTHRWIVLGLVLALGLTGYYAWRKLQGTGVPAGIASGNGRIEAIEIDISTKAPGRVKEIMVNEGDFVKAGQVLARMDTAQLEAQRRQAEAHLQRATVGVETARSIVSQREAEKRAAAAVVAQRQAELDAATKRLDRSEMLGKTKVVSQQVLDDDRAAVEGARAALAAAQAQSAATDAGISAAQALVVDAQAAVEAAGAAIASIAADIDDATLTSPRDGRVQYRVAQPGEVLPAGGRVLDLVDLGDVYMTFFLPTEQAGRIAVGAETRIALDAAPEYVIPASVSYVADVAQFTPKTVETAVEREKLMFRVKARIDPKLLQKYIAHVKTGLPGVAYVRIDPDAEWPASLRAKLLE